MMRPRIAAARPCFPEEDLETLLPSIEKVLRSGWLILGEHTREFERRFAEYVGTEHAVAVSTCTAALQIALRYYRVGGREVITPTNNFIGVVGAIVAEGATPVLAEMDAATFCIDTEDALARITPRTAGVIVTHIAGLVYPDIDRLRAACAERGLFLIEDASHAAGASIGGRKAGSLADCGCFSFYPTKLVTTGTGGMVTTDDARLAAYARSVRHHGVAGGLDDVVDFGNDWCMSEIHALLGLHQLARLDDGVEHRNRLAAAYRAGLAGADWIEFPDHGNEQRHAYYKLPLLLRDDASRYRARLREAHGIENGAIYDPPCHLQPVLRRSTGSGPGMFPCAEATLARQVCPPVHSSLPLADVHGVIEAMIGTAAELGLDR